MLKIFKKLPKVKAPQIKFKKFKKWAMPSFLLLILLISLLATYQVILENRFVPFTYIGDTNVSLLTKKEASQILQDKINNRTAQKLTFNYNTHNYMIDLATTSASVNLANSLDQGLKNGHNGSLISQLTDQIKNLFFANVIFPEVNLPIEKQLGAINSQVFMEPVNAKLVIDESNTATSSAKISVTDGANGQELDHQKLTSEVISYINFGHYNNQLPVIPKEPKVTTSEALTAKQFLESNSADPISLNYDKNQWIIDTKTLLSFINLEKDHILDNDKMTNYLKEIVAGKIDQEVQEGLFEFHPDTKRVAQFEASQEGRKLNIDKTIGLITYSLENSGPKQINLPVEVVKPTIQTADVNNLGINELVGRGISNFAGSIANRIYNVGLGASKINGVLIAPGEVFSFNKIVGDISAATGFKQAYVIKSGRTVLDDGGGICQVSTTLFRAVLNAGLPVVERTAHAYRVSYYEQGFSPGLDATIFHPTVDLKFKNDTSKHILIQAYVTGTTMYVDLYGTSDGRTVEITKPVILSQTPPLPELRQDDPELPIGTVKQVDWPAWGAKVTFKRTVTRNGETLISENFNSNYRPWQAVYLVGTKPI